MNWFEYERYRNSYRSNWLFLCYYVSQNWTLRLMLILRFWIAGNSLPAEATSTDLVIYFSQCLFYLLKNILCKATFLSLAQ